MDNVYTLKSMDLPVKMENVATLKAKGFDMNQRNHLRSKKWVVQGNNK